MKQLVTFSLSLPSVLGTNTQFSSGEPSSWVWAMAIQEGNFDL